jgi:hypothetical protein
MARYYIITTPSERFLYKGQVEAEGNMTWLLSHAGNRTFQAPTECFREIEYVEYLVHRMNGTKEL